MNGSSPLYPTRLREASALLTDMYEITMAHGYWKSGMSDREAVFHVTFRTPPFRSGYTVAAGLADVISLLAQFRFSDDDLAYLGSLQGNVGRPLFESGFIEHLREMEFACDVDAMPEGSLVFPHEPLLRVRGPLDQAQIIETFLLNTLNFQSLIATKAARICTAAGDDTVIEFGLRRAQGVDGGLAATRASFIGGCAATSSVLAGRLFGIPVKGTHAHSWVMAFDDEPTAFRAFAESMPDDCILLVDTYDTLEGVREAIRIGPWLRERGHELAGVRLDSGDLAYLSIEARRLLDEAGFPGAAIVASNELNEHVITSLKEQGATISVWGVGTHLVTAHDQPALGGVYKLGAIREAGANEWSYRLKLSEQPAKISIPGVLNVRRFRDGDFFVADMIFDEAAPPPSDEAVEIIDPANELRRRNIPAGQPAEDLLVPVFRGGGLVYDIPPLSASRERTLDQLRRIHQGHKRLLNAHEYPAGLERGVFERRAGLVRQARQRLPRRENQRGTNAPESPAQ